MAEPKRSAVLFLALAVAALAGTAAADFQLNFLTVNVALKEDGSVHLIEDYRLFLDTNGSVQLYDQSQEFTGNYIDQWRSLSKLGEIRLHIDSSQAAVPADSVIIRPQPKDSCSSAGYPCFATLRLEYDAFRDTDNGTGRRVGVFAVNNSYKPRTTKYTLNTLALSFERTVTRDIVLPASTLLVIRVPEDAVVTDLDPIPPALGARNLPIHDVHEFSYMGRTTLAGLRMTVEREQPLSREVADFFVSLRRRAVGLLSSTEGLALLAILAVGVVSFILLRARQE